MNIRMILHDNKVYEAYFETFNLADYIAEVNSNPNHMIQFGERGIAKHTIKVIERVEEEPTSPTA